MSKGSGRGGRDGDSLERRPLVRIELGHLAQVVGREELEQVAHRRVTPAALLEREQLVKQVAGGLTNEAGKIVVAGPFAARTMARRAAGGAGLHRVRRLGRALG